MSPQGIEQGGRNGAAGKKGSNSRLKKGSSRGGNRESREKAMGEAGLGKKSFPVPFVCIQLELATSTIPEKTRHPWDHDRRRKKEPGSLDRGKGGIVDRAYSVRKGRRAGVGRGRKGLSQETSR